MPSETRKQEKRPSDQSPLIPKEVRVFLLFAFGISWGLFVIRGSLPWPEWVEEALRILIKFGPSLAGISAVLLFGGFAGLRKLLGRLVVPRPRIRWIAFALFLPLGILVVALPLRVLLGGSVSPLNPVKSLDALSLFFSLLATRFFLGGGLGEELGWRGFMLPVQQERTGGLKASLLIGLFHGAWHIPAIGVGAVFLTLFTISGAIIFTWMYNRTGGNLFLPALMHATANASLPFLENLVPEIDNEILFPILVFGLWAAVAVVVVWWVGVEGLDPKNDRGRGPL